MMADISGMSGEIDRCRADRDLHLEKMAALGELAAAIAHDIRNPLAGISGVLQILAEDFPDDNPWKEISGEILEEIGRLDSAVRDLLLFASPPALLLLPVDMSVLIGRVRDRIAPRAGILKVRIDLPADGVPALMADAEQLERALTNLASHSLESMTSGGNLKFALHDRPDLNEIRITVSDTGPGIPQEKLKDIFKPSFSSKHLDNGLGLAISRDIVVRHKGRIEVESEEGNGTLYCIALPLTG